VFVQDRLLQGGAGVTRPTGGKLGASVIEEADDRWSTGVLHGLTRVNVLAATAAQRTSHSATPELLQLLNSFF
jgi:hypothetical protein